MAAKQFNDGLLDYLASSPTPFHATASAGRLLEEAGFQRLDERDAWKLEKGKRYYVTRNDSAVVAFRLGGAPAAETGFRMVGAHTDSPCLKVKPHADLESYGYLKLGVEVYGGVLLAPWFDRDLSLAGRVGYQTKKGEVRSVLVDFERPVAVIPSLAIHLNREVNDKHPINRQTEMPPILFQVPRGTEIAERDFKRVLLDELQREGHADAERVLEFELALYDTQRPAVIGLSGDFIASARLDNLLSCYVGLAAIRDAGDAATSLFVGNDHEEVGSASAPGASGTFVRSVCERIAGSGEALTRALQRSIFLSTDNAHGIHPNYPDRHDPKHAPLLNAGPVLKINVNQRYATTSESGSIFAWLCQKAQVPFQRFVARADMPCGSTIGPLTATVLGVRVVDVGLPTFAMHSIRELAGARDPELLYRALRVLYGEAQIPGL